MRMPYQGRLTNRWWSGLRLTLLHICITLLAIGIAFSLPIGVVSNPIRTQDGVVVLRVDRRVDADRTAWEAQKAAQRQQLMQSLRQQRIQAFLQQLRADAKVDDRRKSLAQAARQTTS